MNLNLENAIQEAKNLYGGAKTVLEYKKAAKEIKILYEQFQESEDIVIQYFKVLRVLCLKEEYDCKETVKEIKRVYDNHQSSEKIAKEYLLHLVNQCSKEQEESVFNEMAKEAKEVYKHHQNSKDVAADYLKFLFRLSEQQVEESVVRKIAAEAKNVYNLNQSSVNAAINYIRIYNSFIWLNIEATEFNEIVMELKRVYEQHKSSEDVTKNYISALRSLSWTQIEESSIVYLSDEMGRVYNQTQGAEFVASEYLVILLKLIEKQEGLNKINNTAQKISDVLQKHLRLTYIVEDTIDLWIFSDNVKENDKVKLVNVLTAFYKQDETAPLLSQTKYSFLFDPFKKLSDEDVKKLIEIFWLIQKIKKQLVIKNPSEVMFGHYTSGKVLQMLLHQTEKVKYSIESRSRLSNVNYMNDPSEGKMLDQFLQMDSTFQQLSLKPSQWFLMSLTTSIDKLSMWSQYGDRAEGVCLVLNACDFSSVDFPSDMEWLTLKKNSLMSNEDLENVVSRRNIDSKDFLYRIGYLSMQSEKEISLRYEFNKCFNDKEIDNINNSLQSLKSIVKGIDQESIFYEKADECLEEIRYLFKSADYSYESELRVLKYMPLDPDNKKIKIDDSGKIAKIYIERDNPIKIEEVIFGPKFSHPENVTPLLHLLDKNIKFSESKIPFK